MALALNNALRCCIYHAFYALLAYFPRTDFAVERQPLLGGRAAQLLNLLLGYCQIGVKENDYFIARIPARYNVAAAKRHGEHLLYATVYFAVAQLFVQVVNMV